MTTFIRKCDVFKNLIFEALEHLQKAFSNDLAEFVKFEERTQSGIIYFT